MNKTISFVVPMFNEAEVIENTIESISGQIDSLKELGIGEMQIIVVDDGSKDGSFDVLNRCVEKRESLSVRIDCIRFSRNFGHSAAVFAGLESAEGSYVVIIDADLQDPPELICPMLKKLMNNDADVVYGKRTQREGEHIFKRFTAWLFYRLLSFLSGTDIPKDTGDFRVMTKQVADAVLMCEEKEPFLRGLVAWVGFEQIPFEYLRKSRKQGKTKYSTRKMVKYAASAIMSFSSFPLRVAIYIGFTGLLLTLGIGIWAFSLKVFGGNELVVPGWASIVVGYTLGQSVTLILVGLIGIYIGKIYSEICNRPRYIIRDKIAYRQTGN